MSKRIIWHIEKRKLSDLKAYENNPRIITELGLNQLKESFDEIGMAQPININLDNTILSGHARTQQLKKENPDQEVDVYVPDCQLTPEQEEAVIIRMNKNVAGDWDFTKLDMHFSSENLISYGFSEVELNINIGDLNPSESKTKNTNKEINTDDFGSDLEHTCPKCGFEYD